MLRKIIDYLVYQIPLGEYENSWAGTRQLLRREWAAFLQSLARMAATLLVLVLVLVPLFIALLALSKLLA